MRVGVSALGLAALLCGGCAPRTALTGVQTAEVERSVREFAATVAHDVTAEGPAAWRRHFADTPAFFMAFDGQLAFRDSAAVTAGIADVARAFPRVELQWGDDLRVDALAPGLAMMGASWHEMLVHADGAHEEERGYFTGLAEQRGGRWQFRDVHWSMAHPAAGAH